MAVGSAVECRTCAAHMVRVGVRLQTNRGNKSLGTRYSDRPCGLQATEALAVDHLTTHECLVAPLQSAQASSGAADEPKEPSAEDAGGPPEEIKGTPEGDAALEGYLKGQIGNVCKQGVW